MGVPSALSKVVRPAASVGDGNGFVGAALMPESHGTAGNAGTDGSSPGPTVLARAAGPVRVEADIYGRAMP